MNYMKIRRGLCLLLSFVMLLSVLTACGRSKDHRPADRQTETRKETSSREEPREAAKDEVRTDRPEETQETEAPAKKANQLPSFLKFAKGSNYEVSQMDTHDGYTTIVYKSTTGNDVAYAVDFIAMLLDEENCAVILEETKDRDDWYLVKKLLDHPMDAKKYRMDALDDFYDHIGDLFVKINYYKDDGTVTFAISYSDDFELEDTGDAPTPGPTRPGEKDCTWCGGDGRCNECGGDGRVYNWLPGTTTYVDQNCTNCNMGRCRQCGGSGKQ